MQGFADPKIEKLPLDVTSDDDVMRVVRYIEEAEGRIDIVVNNAGVMGIGAWFELLVVFLVLWCSW